jgi:hypothetical protein
VLLPLEITGEVPVTAVTVPPPLAGVAFSHLPTPVLYVSTCPFVGDDRRTSVREASVVDPLVGVAFSHFIATVLYVNTWPFVGLDIRTSVNPARVVPAVAVNAPATTDKPAP